MDIIFLDVDGVLCTPRSFALSRLLRRPMDRQLFDPGALFWLRRLVKKTGARVVLSSSWREELYLDEPVCRAAVENLYRALETNATPITDTTPLLPAADKGAEIAAWLAAHPCKSYAVLDDRDCFAGVPAVRAHWVAVDRCPGPAIQRTTLRRGGCCAILPAEGGAVCPCHRSSN